MVVSCDVVFDENAAWDWDSPGTGEAGGFTSTFVIKHLVIHGGGDAGEEVPSTSGGCRALQEGCRALRERCQAVL